MKKFNNKKSKKTNENLSGYDRPLNIRKEIQALKDLFKKLPKP